MEWNFRGQIAGFTQRYYDDDITMDVLTVKVSLVLLQLISIENSANGPSFAQRYEHWLVHTKTPRKKERQRLFRVEVVRSEV